MVCHNQCHFDSPHHNPNRIERNLKSFLWSVYEVK